MVTYYGLTPNEIRQTNLERFQTKDETRFLVGTLKREDMELR